MSHDATAYAEAPTALESLLSVSETAAVLGVGTRTVYRILKAGEITPTRVGHRLRFEPEEIRRYIAARRRSGP